MANARYTISIPANDRELIHFIEKMKESQSLSGYIRKLIRDDMENGNNIELEKIYEYVSQRIKEDGYIMEGKDSNKASSFIDDADKDIIMDLF